MRKWTPDMTEAYARKTERELAARGISLQPDVIVGKIELDIEKVDRIVKPKSKIEKMIKEIEKKVKDKPKKKRSW